MPSSHIEIMCSHYGKSEMIFKNKTTRAHSIIICYALLGDKYEIKSN